MWGVLGNNKFEYRVMIFNGNGITRSVNDNDKFQYNARVSFQPNGGDPASGPTRAPTSPSRDFETKALGEAHLRRESPAFEQNDLRFVATDLKTNLKSTLYEVDAMLQVPGLLGVAGTATAARVRARADGHSTPKFDTSGWYAQAGFFLKPEKWEIARPLRRAGPERSGGPGQDHRDPRRHQLLLRASRAQGAGRLRPDQDRDLERGPGSKNNELRIQTQFIF